MTLTRKWALVLCLALSFIKPSNSQVDSSTGNLVNFTGTPTDTTGNWVNGVYVKGLTCWQPGGPGNCGPYPNVQTNGSINFSYGQINLNQVVNIKNALADAGTGVQVSGFHFGFTAKNGNGWDNGQQDYLDAYVKFYNSKATVIESYDYAQYTNRKYNWSDFNFNETFTKPYDISKLAAAQYGFIGRDTNGWAGPYGPEIMNVSFSLNYRVDPCVANPTSSPSCPGFSNLIKSSTISLATTSTSSAVPDTATTSTPIVNAGGVQLSSTGTISAPDNIPQVLKDTQTVTQQAQTSTPPTASTQQQQSSKSTPNMSLIMSVLNQVQANDKATQTAAVQNANQVTASSSAKAQEQANQVVEALNTMSQASSQASMLQVTNNAKLSMPTTQTNTSVVQLQQPASATQMSFMTPIQPITLTPPQQSMGQITFGSANVTASVLPPQVPVTRYESQQKVDTSLVAVVPQYEQPKFENKQQEVDMPTVSFNTNMSRGSNVNDLFASKINIESLQSEQSIDTVNKNVSANELAGNVDIANIATTPKGFEAYSFVLKDAAFYKTEAIYKDQKTVDNARLFRSLSNDRLHQEMIDQQYKLGN